MRYLTFWVVSCALKADSEFRSVNPKESRWGIRESRYMATVEVVRSPMPRRSLSPPYDDPGGTRYLPGTKFSGPKGEFQ